MREIKFRGYAVEEMVESQWIYGFGVKNIDYVDGTVEWHLHTLNGVYEVEPESIGQFTGLKDKNGKEIYEGDIVTGQSFESSMLNHWKSGILKHLDYEVEYVPEMYVIKYHEASFKTFNLKGRWVAILNHHVSSMVDDLQVVGNIYENPELLKEESK